MLFDPSRHEELQPIAWDEARVRAAIKRIVAETEAAFSPERYWPTHPRDLEPDDDPHQVSTTLYFGACGVIWALHYLQSVGAATLARGDFGDLETLLARNRATLAGWESDDFASYLMGDTPILMLAHGRHADAATADRLAALIQGNVDHPARELMWGAPGTMLAALFMHRRTGEARFAALFRASATRLWSQLEWSDEHGCAYWTQDLYGETSTYLDAVHGFAATAFVLIKGRDLLPATEWADWQRCIVNTISRTAVRDGDLVNWPAWLQRPGDRPNRSFLMQFCHGAPGFVICLAGLPDDSLDALLVGAGEAVWAAGPLAKGSNLCHGTGGNGYAFLELYRRTGNARWLERARAFAMHGILQTETDARRHGRLRFSLWTGDPGFAIYLWDCLRGEAAFPTLDRFYA
jgi:hypothetical protein